MAFQMRVIPTENRALMMAYRDGVDLEQFLDQQWKRRAKEYPGEEKSIGRWPKTHGPQPALPPLSQAKITLSRFGT